MLWLTKEVVGIEGDAVFIALLLVPALVYLEVTGKLARVELFGASAVFRDLQKSVEEVGQREAERAAYLGKLSQVLAKDDSKPALIYADVDGLCQVTRELYLEERDRNSRAASQLPEARTRKREEDIRNEIIDELELALTDAFYDASLKDASLKKAKCDVFRLVEPDIAMIVRSVTQHQAHEIAESGEKLFRDVRGCTATTAVLAADYVEGSVTPQRLDELAGQGLTKAEDGRKAGP